MIKSLTIIFFCLFLGELVSALARLPVPGNVLGMVLLAGGLQQKLIRVESVKPAADVLLKNMAFLFVPPGVGLILYLDLLKAEFLAIGLSIFLSTALVLATVGLVQQKLERDHG